MWYLWTIGAISSRCLGGQQPASWRCLGCPKAESVERESSALKLHVFFSLDIFSGLCQSLFGYQCIGHINAFWHYYTVVPLTEGAFLYHDPRIHQTSPRLILMNGLSWSSTWLWVLRPSPGFCRFVGLFDILLQIFCRFLGVIPVSWWRHQSEEILPAFPNPLCTCVHLFFHSCMA